MWVHTILFKWFASTTFLFKHFGENVIVVSVTQLRYNLFRLFSTGLIEKQNKRSWQLTFCFLNFIFHQILIWHLQCNYKSITSSLHSALHFRLPHVPCVSSRTRPKRSAKVEKNRMSPWEGAPKKYIQSPYNLWKFV